MVKLWFNGCIDYVLLVVDFVVWGFLLIGGWLDYIDGCLVVVLVYCFVKYFVDLYVCFEVGSDIELMLCIECGYQLMVWCIVGMGYWVIIDVFVDVV